MTATGKVDEFGTKSLGSTMYLFVSQKWEQYQKIRPQTSPEIKKLQQKFTFWQWRGRFDEMKAFVEDYEARLVNYGFTGCLENRGMCVMDEKDQLQMSDIFGFPLLSLTTTDGINMLMQHLKRNLLGKEPKIYKTNHIYYNAMFFFLISFIVEYPINDKKEVLQSWDRLENSNFSWDQIQIEIYRLLKIVAEKFIRKRTEFKEQNPFNWTTEEMHYISHKMTHLEFEPLFRQRYLENFTKCKCFNIMNMNWINLETWYPEDEDERKYQNDQKTQDLQDIIDLDGDESRLYLLIVAHLIFSIDTKYNKYQYQIMNKQTKNGKDAKILFEIIRKKPFTANVKALRIKHNIKQKKIKLQKKLISYYRKIEKSRSNTISNNGWIQRRQSVYSMALKGAMSGRDKQYANPQNMMKQRVFKIYDCTMKINLQNKRPQQNKQNKNRIKIYDQKKSEIIKSIQYQNDCNLEDCIKPIIESFAGKEANFWLIRQQNGNGACKNNKINVHYVITIWDEGWGYIYYQLLRSLQKKHVLHHLFGWTPWCDYKK